MDDSTYNNIYRNTSPMTPSTPGNAFQTNVNRTKTRKWVEAKKQDYGGDDWGNEFDDDEEPQEPQPPSRVTAGLRPIGQATQLPTPQSSSNRAVSQPAVTFGHIRGESFGRRNPSGPPALHIQTQQPTPVKQPEPIETEPYTDLSTFNEPDHRYPERVISPQSATSRPFPSLPGYPGRRDYSPATQDRGRGSPAPAPTNAALVSTSRFPPRKSSMGQQDDASGSRPGSRPGSSGRPWNQQRSDSPEYQALASAGTPNKPLPFIRPADIYRRMEEEKEKERRSMDSTDNIQGMRTSFDREDDSEASRGLKSTLTPVAERKSEYGLDRLTHHVDKVYPAETAAPEPTTKPEEVFSSPYIAAPVALSSRNQPLKSSEDRRKSMSPRLPDLTRMSGFGTDFFSAPGFPDTEEPAQATLFGSRSEHRGVDSKQTEANQASIQPDSTLQPSDGVPDSSEKTPPKNFQGNVGNDVHGASSLIEGPALSDEDTAVLRSPPSEISEYPGSQGQNAASQFSPPSPDATVKERTKPSRPSIPGGWVSETTNFGSATPTPMERPEPTISQLSPVQDVSESWPVTDLAVGDIAPTTTVKHAHSLNSAPNTIPKPHTMSGASEYDFGNTTGRHDQAMADEVIAGRPEHLPTPQALPPLHTPDPLSSSNAPPLVNQDTAISGAPSSGDSPSKYSSSTYPRTATTASGFTPTAPLNPKRGDTSSSEFVAPDFLPRNFTMSSMDTSSPNESDKLREDIIKSLSPVDSALANSTTIPSGADQSLPAPSPELTRESRYLSGVYDDYMGLNEDKSLRDTSQVWRDEGSTTSPALPESRSVKTPALEGHPPPVAATSIEQTSSATGPVLERRFSWEQLAEESDVNPVEAPVIRAQVSEAVHESAETSTATSATVHGDTPALALQIEPDNGGTMSHQVSLVSSHTPGGLGIAGIEPPSPISVMSSERSPGVTDHKNRRLSLAEEKVLIQVTSNPVSPSPEEEHPALATRTPREASPVLDSANPVASPPKFVNITGWREILSLPSPALRIQKFDETRTQYTALESGLSNWLEHMQGQPGHEPLPSSSASSAGIAATAASGHGPLQSSPTGTQPPVQQPYYQQYLNASNDKLASAPAGLVRQSTGNALSSGRQPVSGFGTSKNQVGTKGKEFLQAAGSFGNKATKAGMKSGLKLFNKGKDKLRGSGDKVFP